LASGAHARIANCEAFDANKCGTANGCGGNDYTDWFSAGSGVGISTPSSDSVLVGSDAHDNGIERRDHGLYIAGQNMTIAYNRIWNNFGYGLHAYSGGGVFSGMQAHSNHVWSNGPPGAVESSTGGILCHRGCKQAQIFNNISHDNIGAGIMVGGDGSDATSVDVFNNTIYRNDGWQLYIGGNAYGVTVDNNILLDDIGATELLWKESGALGVTSNHNVLYPDGAGAVGWSGTSSTAAIYRGTSGQDADSVIQDPMLANVWTGDVHLKAGSPAIGAGRPDGAPPLDYDGVQRSATTPSIGACEYQP
jgi:hypothetical protein